MEARGVRGGGRQPERLITAEWATGRVPAASPRFCLR